MPGLTHYPERVAAVRRLVAAGDIEALAEELVQTAELNGDHWGHDGRQVTDVLDGQREELRVRLALALFERASRNGVRAQSLVDILLRKVSFRVAPEALEILLARAASQVTYWPHNQLAEMADAWLATGRRLAPEVVGVIRRTALAEWQKGRLHELAALPGNPVLNPGEAWADQVLAELGELGDDWRALLDHAMTATSARPSAAWERSARALLERIRVKPARRTISCWLALVGRSRTGELRRRPYDPDVNEAFDPHNATVLRGLIWLLALLPAHPESARALGGLVETALRKVAGIGPRNPKVANAAVYGLSRMDGQDALAQLARLAARVTYKGTLNVLNAALEQRASALGLSRDEVEELAVPAFGLTGVGSRVDRFGEVAAGLTVSASTAAITWHNAAGKVVKLPPASVRRDHGEALAELKATVKDIDKMLAAQAERLDRQFLAQRSWPYQVWRQRYLDHPLVGTLGRRLIWIVGGVPCAYSDGALYDVHEAPVPPDDDATVQLWHPIGRDIPEIVAWRDWLERHSVVQPFKQAHREVYLLTAAEERTAVYSNRFAAHILRQHQFHALAAVRRWRNRLRLMVDDSYPPAVRELPGWALRAEFWVEGIGEEYGADTTESGAYHRIVTDQVRFYPLAVPGNLAHAGGGGYEQWVPAGEDPAQPVPLDQVPPLVFSEVMRDVDLFVGVASVGNDPTWQDGGPGGWFREYWASYSFGELSATAQTRRDLLERLLPRLAIADQCTLERRFLHVKGGLRTYKIHLGSGNILMTPNDQYLCIVPRQAPASVAGQVFLPFEGDRVLSVVLSKAMLLAKDTEITDPTITRQITRR